MATSNSYVNISGSSEQSKEDTGTGEDDTLQEEEAPPRGQ